MSFSNFPHTVRILSVMDIRRKKKYKGGTDARSFHSLSFRVKGNAEFICGDETVLAKEKSILLIPEDVPYQTKTSSEHLFVVHFKTDQPFEKNKISSFIPEASAIYENLFKKMYGEWKAKNPGYYFAATSCFYSILENIEKDLGLQKYHTNADKMNKVVEFIHTNFTDNLLTVTTLADLFGTSETYFRKEFKKTYNTTPLKYINNLRTKYAIELLESGYFSANQVSIKSGFSDAKYFSRVFKEKTGRTPSEIIRKADL